MRCRPAAPPQQTTPQIHPHNAAAPRAPSQPRHARRSAPSRAERPALRSLLCCVSAAHQSIITVINHQSIITLINHQSRITLINHQAIITLINHQSIITLINHQSIITRAFQKAELSALRYAARSRTAEPDTCLRTHGTRVSLGVSPSHSPCRVSCPESAQGLAPRDRQIQTDGITFTRACHAPRDRLVRQQARQQPHRHRLTPPAPPALLPRPHHSPPHHSSQVTLPAPPPSPSP